MPPKFSNPTALGLASFALSLTVLTFANLGWMGAAPAIALAVFFGGIVEICVGFAELFTGNTFAMTVFGAFGAFWICFGGTLYAMINNWLPAAAFKGFLIGFPIAWLIITLIFLVATFRLAKALVWIFVTLSILWILLIASQVTGSSRSSATKACSAPPRRGICWPPSSSTAPSAAKCFRSADTFPRQPGSSNKLRAKTDIG
jgi:succinate-acetate transporter protein